jgi:hypothetical protein
LPEAGAIIGLETLQEVITEKSRINNIYSFFLTFLSFPQK